MSAATLDTAEDRVGRRLQETARVDLRGFTDLEAQSVRGEHRFHQISANIVRDIGVSRDAIGRGRATAQVTQEAREGSAPVRCIRCTHGMAWPGTAWPGMA